MPFTTGAGDVEIDGARVRVVARGQRVEVDLLASRAFPQAFSLGRLAALRVLARAAPRHSLSLCVLVRGFPLVTLGAGGRDSLASRLLRVHGLHLGSPKALPALHR